MPPMSELRREAADAPMLTFGARQQMLLDPLVEHTSGGISAVQSVPAGGQPPHAVFDVLPTVHTPEQLMSPVGQQMPPVVVLAGRAADAVVVVIAGRAAVAARVDVTARAAEAAPR